MDVAPSSTRKGSSGDLPLAAFLPHLPFDLGSLVVAIPGMLSAGQGIIHHRLQLRTASVLALGDNVGRCEGKRQHYGCRRSDKAESLMVPLPLRMHRTSQPGEQQ